MRILLAAAAALLPVSLSAQTGSFTAYGSGCSAGGGNACLTANMNTAFVGSTGSSANFAIKVNSGASLLVICGFEFRFARPNGATGVNVWIYDALSTGAPGKILASGTMPVTTTVQTQRVTFTTPVIINANTDFFLVVDNRVGLQLPVGTGTATIRYWNGPPVWNGPFTSVAWNYNILCCGGSPAPAISNTGIPTINNSFSIDLASTAAQASCILAFGVGRTNIPLDLAGAPGCVLYTDPLLLLGGLTDAQGNYAQKIGLPNDANLIGFKVQCQYAVPDKGNALGLVFTAGGEIVPGK